MTEATAVVWEGAEALRPLLVPVASIERHPRNPRRGDVQEIAGSLRRFGQVRPVLVHDDKIIAGNHTYLAAVELGWTHVAAVENEFASEAEARAYLLADNRLPELGGYNRAQLVVLLAELEEAGSWAGTGYEQKNLDEMRALEKLAAEGAAVLAEPPPFDPAEFGMVEMREVVLLYTAPQYEEFGSFLRALRERLGTEGVVATVLKAVEADARALNLGAPPEPAVAAEAL